MNVSKCVGFEIVNNQQEKKFILIFWEMKFWRNKILLWDDVEALSLLNMWILLPLINIVKSGFNMWYNQTIL